MKKILLTGASGLIGRHIASLLSESFDLLLTDLREGEVDGRKVHALDICDYDAVNAMVKGVDGILHMAIASSGAFVTDTARFDADEGEEYLKFNQLQVDVNMRGTYNLMEAARQNGVKRMVQASSLTILIGQPRYEQIDDSLPPRPSNFYAVTKMFCENLGEFFHRRHGLEVFSIRLGTPFPQPWHEKSKQWLKSEVGRRTFISFRDIAGALVAAMNAPWTRYAPFTVVSASRDLAYDISLAKEITGWEPLDYFTDEGIPVPVPEGAV